MTTISDSETNTTLSGSEDSVLITSSGSLNSGGNAVAFSGADFGYVSNAGQILAQNDGMVISSDSSRSYIVNQSSGGISGYYGIYNAGSATSIHNNGLIDSQEDGVTNVGVNSFLFNSGQISSTSAALELGGGGEIIANSGTLYGAADSIVSYNNGAGVSITNIGTIIGNILLGTTGTTIENSGTIQGSITFGDGTNTFDGRHGSVTGTITGGSGVDTFRAGNDGEEMGGGAGHDVLYAGKGDDIFDFASFASADSDVIHKFNATDDAISLASSIFTKLKAGMTPEFAVGTSASDATDHLFYDSDTGNLYYDTNGNASGGAHLVATLDPHLALTASNFIVT